MLALAHGLDPARAGESVDVIAEELAHSMANVRAEIAACNVSWIHQLTEAGGRPAALRPLRHLAARMSAEA